MSSETTMKALLLSYSYSQIPIESAKVLSFHTNTNNLRIL